MEAVKNTKQYVDYQTQKSGGGCGCWAIGCGSIILLFVALCGGGFYTIFYSSAPLKLIETAIEDSGEVEIDGLSGNFMSGFTIDEMRFKTEGDEWSHLSNIKFKYKSSWFQSDRIIIEDISVDGGTIYARFNPNNAELEMDPDFDAEFDEAQNEFKSEFGQANFSGIREVRVDLIRIANLKIVNPDTQDTVTLDEIKFDSFHFEDGVLQDMGNLLVNSSQMDLSTSPSQHFTEYPNAKRYSGKINAEMDHRFLKDLPIDVDLAVDDDGEMLYYASLYDGDVIADRQDDVTQFTVTDFNPAEYFKSDRAGILPSQINVKYSAKSGFLPTSVNPDGSFNLGQTRFSQLTLNKAAGSAEIVGTATVDGQKVTAQVQMSQRTGWRRISLTSDQETPDRELWAQTVYGESFANLKNEQQQLIAQAIQYNKKPEEPVAEPGDESKKDASGKAETPAEGLEPLLPAK